MTDRYLVTIVVVILVLVLAMVIAIFVFVIVAPVLTIFSILPSLAFVIVLIVALFLVLTFVVFLLLVLVSRCGVHHRTHGKTDRHKHPRRPHQYRFHGFHNCHS